MISICRLILFCEAFALPTYSKSRHWPEAPSLRLQDVPGVAAVYHIKFTLNLRLVKAFALGSKEIKSPDASSSTQGKTGSIYKNAWQPLYAIRFELIVNNIFNHPNLAIPIGNLSSPFFGKSIALAGSPFSTTAASRQIIFRTVFRF